MAHPASRVLTMLELLQAHRHMTGSDLAERLAVDERTVRRYAATLTDLGIPVTTLRGRHGGYQLLPGFKLPPLMLTDDEAVAVVLGLMAADRIGLGAETPAAAAASAKISRVLPAALADRLDALRTSLGFTMRRSERPGPGATGQVEQDTPDTGTLLTLSAATRAHERIDLTYRTRVGDLTRRDLDPYGIVFHSRRWYVVGHDHRSAEIRSLRVDRIVEARPTGATFEPVEGFDAVDHLNRQWVNLPYGWRVEVLVKEAGIEEIRRHLPASVAELSMRDRDVLLCCRAHDLNGMARMLAGLGRPFQIIEPYELRGAVADHAAVLMRSALRGAAPGPEPE
jgi:predicted DNA-binding transcriptional regulator YafY